MWHDNKLCYLNSPTCEWLSCGWIIPKTISSSFNLYNHKPELCWIRYNKWRLSFWCKASRETLPSHCCLTLSKREAEGWNTTVQVRQSTRQCGWNSIWTAAVLVSLKYCQYCLISTVDCRYNFCYYYTFSDFSLKNLTIFVFKGSS